MLQWRVSIVPFWGDHETWGVLIETTNRVSRAPRVKPLNKGSRIQKSGSAYVRLVPQWNSLTPSLGRSTLWSSQSQCTSERAKASHIPLFWKHVAERRLQWSLKSSSGLTMNRRHLHHLLPEALQRFLSENLVVKWRHWIPQPISLSFDFNRAFRHANMYVSKYLGIA